MLIVEMYYIDLEPFRKVEQIPFLARMKPKGILVDLVNLLGFGVTCTATSLAIANIDAVAIVATSFATIKAVTIQQSLVESFLMFIVGKGVTTDLA